MTAAKRKWEGWLLTAAGYAALGLEPPAVQLVRARPERYQAGVEYVLTEQGAAALSRTQPVAPKRRPRRDPGGTR